MMMLRSWSLIQFLFLCLSRLIMLGSPFFIWSLFLATSRLITLWSLFLALSQFLMLGFWFLVRIFWFTGFRWIPPLMFLPFFFVFALLLFILLFLFLFSFNLDLRMKKLNPRLTFQKVISSVDLPISWSWPSGQGCSWSELKHLALVVWLGVVDQNEASAMLRLLFEVCPPQIELQELQPKKKNWDT